MIPKPIPEYDSAKIRWLGWNEVVELLRFRDLLKLFIFNSLKTRYKRSFLGVFWTLLNPLLTMTVLALAFSGLFRFSLKNYAVYLLAGLIFWNFFSQATNTAMNAIVWGGGLIRKVYIPRSIFSLSALGSELINLLLSLIPLLLIMIFMDHPFCPALWFLPLAIILMGIFALGISLFISTLALLFVDIAYIYQILLMAWFYLTPIIYPAEILPPSLLQYQRFNPMYHLVDLFRRPIYQGVVPNPDQILAAALFAFLSLAIGWWIFTRNADKFAYHS
jgi:ABC-type polysaccharide/polyol phosphate export permease